MSPHLLPRIRRVRSQRRRAFRTESAYWRQPGIEPLEQRALLAFGPLGTLSMLGALAPVDDIDAATRADQLSVADPQAPAGGSTSSSSTFPSDPSDGSSFTFSVQSADPIPPEEPAWQLPDFHVYDSFLFDELPDLGTYGFQPIHLLTAARLWNPGENRDEPNLERVRELAATLDENTLAIIDVEHWPTRGTEQVVADSIRKLSLIVDTIREEKPEQKIGIYGLLPVRDYWIPVLQDNATEGFLSWEETNARLEELADKVDVIVPSIYAFYPDYYANGDPRYFERERWVEYAIENIQQARAYGKPVLAFLWPRYHGGGGSVNPQAPDFRYWKYQQISAEFWQTMLEVSYKYANSVAVFDWEFLVTAEEPSPREFNVEDPWFTTTQTFIGSIHPTGANGDSMAIGMRLEGDFMATYEEDQQYQVLSETRWESASENYIGLDHQWSFFVPNGASVLEVTGHQNSGGETFVFDYSTDGVEWISTGIQLSFVEGTYFHVFDEPVTGQLFVRVRDLQRLAEESSEQVYIDRLMVRNLRPGDGPLPEISIAGTSVEETEESVLANFTVTRSGDVSGWSIVRYETGDGTAVADSDYVRYGPAAIYFAPGETTKTISIVVLQDDEVEEDESFEVRLLDPIFATLGTEVAEGQIVDDDLPAPPPPPPPVQGTVDVIPLDGELNVTEGGETDLYDVQLSSMPEGGVVEVTVTADGQLELSLDGENFSNEVVVTLHDTSPQTVTVRALDDANHEGPHTGTITHAITQSDAANYPVETEIDRLTVAIEDDDPAPGRIIIEKITSPSDGDQEFEFAASFDEDGFTLTGGEQHTSGDLPPGTYTVEELLAAGWSLEQIEILTDDAEDTSETGDNTATLDLDPGEEIVVRFSNHKIGVESIQIDDGTSQRSMVRSITITFTTEVDLANETFTLVGPDGEVVPVNVHIDVVDGKTVVTLSFTGDDIIGGSLPNGRYTLTIHGSQVSRGQATMDQDVVDEFFRLFGDSTGEGVVGIPDFNDLRKAFQGDEAMMSLFDFQNDGVMGTPDFNEFRKVFGTTIG